MQLCAFIEDEADNWYKRWKGGGFQLTSEKKILAEHIKDLKGYTLDVGCANGYQIAHLKGAWGVDPSSLAVFEGRKENPHLSLVVGASHALPFGDAKFDTVLVSFVLHWVDRQRLLKTLSEIDRVLKVGGHIYLNDFYPDQPIKNPYHHRTDVEIFTYKQRYPTLFLDCGYVEIRRHEYNHDTGDKDICALSVLRKTGV